MRSYDDDEQKWKARRRQGEARAKKGIIQVITMSIPSMGRVAEGGGGCP
jgi:hypothetical protein